MASSGMTACYDLKLNRCMKGNYVYISIPLVFPFTGLLSHDTLSANYSIRKHVLSPEFMLHVLVHVKPSDVLNNRTSSALRSRTQVSTVLGILGILASEIGLGSQALWLCQEDVRARSLLHAPLQQRADYLCGR